MVAEILSLLSVLLNCTSELVQNKVVYDTSVDYVSNSSSFTHIAGSNLSMVLECPDGYIYDKVDIYKHSYTESSDLYLYKVTAQFTPGVVANQNNIKRSDGSSFDYSYLSRGFIHVAAYQYLRTEYGGEIDYKVIAPISDVAATTFASTYGKSVTDSFQGSAGVEVDEAGKLKLTLGAGIGKSLTFSYQESTATSVSDPMLSTQYAFNTNTKKTEAEWSFSTVNGDIAGAKTYWITTYLLFEMSSAVSYWNRDVFNAYIHFGFTGQNYRIETNQDGEQNKKWYESKAYSGVDGGTYFA